ncbi:hypothetical protein AVEN_250822-1 [Araneus ventricosus]|uniref:Retrotransposon gag domain-containing protein n=1 Tax=Araneus ventricosus TaxID=182803 RepID=A0A4Y2MG24_ARAVE|nr:hypothetical protein AVEN_250822-1 [Araneus ventricosus]
MDILHSLAYYWIQLEDREKCLTRRKLRQNCLMIPAPFLSAFHQHQYRSSRTSYLEIPVFSPGDDQQDANKWLKDFQRIATYKHWDDQMCLASVIFYLAGTARQWFDNNEDTFTNFTAFKNSLNNAFCRTEELRRQAERLLLTRTQQIGKTSESYIQNVLSQCRKANPSMSEDEKEAHLKKGIAEDLYQTLLVQDFRRVCKKMP